MHTQQTMFIEHVRLALPEFFTNVSVLEIGSYNVNGTIRDLFTDARWLGIDLVDGPDVDLVCAGEDFQTAARFDVSVSTECFEHTPHYQAIFSNMIRHTRPGGMVIFTCAGEGRHEHGTARSTPKDSPGTNLSNYYRNLGEDDFLWANGTFRYHLFARNPSVGDLYFCGLVGGMPCNGHGFSRLLDLLRRYGEAA